MLRCEVRGVRRGHTPVFYNFLKDWIAQRSSHAGKEGGKRVLPEDTRPEAC